MRRRLAFLLAVCLLFSTWPPTAPIAPQATPALAAPLTMPSGFEDDTVVGGLTGATAIDWAPDGRMFIAEKSGVVKVLASGAAQPTVFVSIADEANSNWDRGLLGLAVHPQFPTKPYIYLLYVYDPPEVAAAPSGQQPAGDQRDGNGARVSRILRVAADPTKGYNEALPSGAPNARTVILGSNSTFANIANESNGADYSQVSCRASNAWVVDCVPADGPSHSIGTVAFGPDGMLYASNGDASHWDSNDKRGVNAQDLDSMTGKIFRIDPDTGAGLSDNPFYNGNPASNRSKVWSYGFRNPFRFTFHPTSGEPVIGDVGGGAWEEINIGKGKNFGWPCYEGRDTGSRKNSAFESQPVCVALYAQDTNGNPNRPARPWYAYPHSGTAPFTGRSITMGDYYLGTTYPISYQGGLFISDFNNEWVKVMTTTGTAAPQGFQFANDGSDTVSGVVQIVAGPDTNLYYVYYSARTNSNTNLPSTSSVHRIRYDGGTNRRPTAIAAATPTNGPHPLPVSFSSVGSYDPDGNETLSYEWNFGTGVLTTSANPVYSYTLPGTYTALLTVTDNLGAHDSASVQITVGNSAPTPQILTPTSGTTFAVGETIAFSGSASDPEDGAVPAAQLSWEVLLHHNEHVHSGEVRVSGSSGSVVAPNHGDGTSLTICLTATDAQGLRATTCRDVRPRTVVYRFESVPSGLEIFYEEAERTTPFTVETIIGAEQLVIAPGVQAQRSFDAWSNGAGAEQRLRIGTTPQTFVASYVNRSPSALPAASPSGTRWPVNVAFSGTLSFDPEGAALGYHWDFGDGRGATEALPSHRYARPGAYQVTLTVTDELGLASSAVITLNVENNAPVGRIEAPAARSYRAGETIVLSGAGDDLEDGALAGERLVWQVVRHRGGLSETLLSTTGATASFVVPQHDGDTAIEVQLTVLDQNGGTHRSNVVLTPEKQDRETHGRVYLPLMTR